MGTTAPPASHPPGRGSLQMLSDAVLARPVPAGNARAFEVIYERYRDDLLCGPGPCRGRTKAVSEALAQCRAGAGTQFAPWAVDALERAVAILEGVCLSEISRYQRVTLRQQVY